MKLSPSILIAIPIFLGILSKAQTPLTAYQTITSTTTASSLNNVNGWTLGNSGIFNSGNTYNVRFGTGYPNIPATTNTMTGFSAGGFSYLPIEGSPSKPFTKINIQRVNNMAFTGARFSGFFEYTSVRTSAGVVNFNVNGTNNLTVYINPSAQYTMEDLLNNYSLGYGSDNLFSNYGDGNAGTQGIAGATGNNIERVDFIYQSGIGATTTASLQTLGFLINERGGNDIFKVAPITSIDALGNVTGLGTVLTVNPASWGIVGPQISTVAFMGAEGAGNIRPKELISMIGNTNGPPSTQQAAGIFFSLQSLGIAINTKVYGLAVFPGDIVANYLTLTTAPQNTPDINTGGLDMISGNIMARSSNNYEILAENLNGKVWNDWNGNGIDDGAGESNVSGNNTSNGGSIVGGGNLYVNIIDAATNNVVAVTPVLANGTYSYNGVLPDFNYKLILTAVSGTIGSNVIASLPAGWANTKENQNGTVDNAGPGSISFTSPFSTGVINQDFGIERPPVADPKTQTTDDSPAGNAIPQNTATQNVSGADPEEGVFGNSNTLIITQLPGNAIMSYNNALVAAGQQITNFNPALLSYTGIANGSTSVVFNYVFIDAAGLQGAAATYTLNWLIPLPITLHGFTAKAIACDEVLLSWLVSDAENFSHFETERSKDGVTFVSLGNISFDASRSNYQYSDRNIQPGKYQYRLRMKDIDGRMKYSPIVSVLVGCNQEQVLVYPNPVQSILNISGLKANEQVKLYTINGQLLVNKKAVSYHEEIDMSKYGAGVYRVMILDKEGKALRSIKIMK